MKLFAAVTGLFQLAFFAFLLWFGAWCVNYTFLHTLHRIIPFIWALVLTIFTGVVALVVKVLILLGILA